jgi:protein involved in polysaccharide export with SLBB domain
MPPTVSSRFLALTAVAALLLGAAPAAGQDESPDSVVARPMATRPELEGLARRLERSGGSDGQTLLARVRARLAQGDFESGDLVLVEVRDEPTLSDTFAVGANQELQLPKPTVGTLSLRGVLRSEFEPRVVEYIGQFLHQPVVRARPLLRLSIQGEVVHAGFYGVPADAILTDAVMAAGGTTKDADMKKIRIERNGEAVWEGRDLQTILSDGRTLDQVYLRDGDQIVIGKRKAGGFEGNLRFLWVVVSLAGGIYGLTRAF